MSADNINQRPRIRPTINSDGNGDMAFVDYHDLHPVNEGSAILAGAAGGALVGGGAGALPTLMREGVRGGSRFGFMGASVVAVGAVIGAAIGGTIAFMNARTHNKWSDRVTAATLEKHENKGPAV